MKNEHNLRLLSVFTKIKTEACYAILTGSLALILNKDIPERDAHDIDIILPFYEDLSKLGKETRIDNPYTTTAMSIIIDGITVHVIIDSSCIWKYKDSPEGRIPVSNSEDIFIEKFRSYALFGADKNRKDILDYIKIRDDKKLSNTTLEIPF